MDRRKFLLSAPAAGAVSAIVPALSLAAPTLLLAGPSLSANVATDRSEPPTESTDSDLDVSNMSIHVVNFGANGLARLREFRGDKIADFVKSYGGFIYAGCLLESPRTFLLPFANSWRDGLFELRPELGFPIISINGKHSMYVSNAAAGPRIFSWGKTAAIRFAGHPRIFEEPAVPTGHVRHTDGKIYPIFHLEDALPSDFPNNAPKPAMLADLFELAEVIPVETRVGWCSRRQEHEIRKITVFVPEQFALVRRASIHSGLPQLTLAHGLVDLQISKCLSNDYCCRRGGLDFALSGRPDTANVAVARGSDIDIDIDSNKTLMFGKWWVL